MVTPSLLTYVMDLKGIKFMSIGSSHFLYFFINVQQLCFSLLNSLLSAPQVEDAGPLYDLMTATLEKLSADPMIARTTTEAVSVLAHCVSYVPDQSSARQVAPFLSSSTLYMCFQMANCYFLVFPSCIPRSTIMMLTFI